MLIHQPSSRSVNQKRTYNNARHQHQTNLRSSHLAWVTHDKFSALYFNSVQCFTFQLSNSSIKKYRFFSFYTIYTLNYKALELGLKVDIKELKSKLILFFITFLLCCTLQHEDQNWIARYFSDFGITLVYTEIVSDFDRRKKISEWIKAVSLIDMWPYLVAFVWCSPYLVAFVWWCSR